ncbi:MAG: NifB/NifX family molybdenum-iron cluster-binding protein [Desulfobacterales bacterium]
MKLAVSSTEAGLDARMDPRFGRCAYFVIVDVDSLQAESLANESQGLGSGAGIQAAQSVAARGVKAVITGNCGPNAVDTLSAAGVALYTGQSGTVREALERFKSGQLTPASGANAPVHAGMAVEPAPIGRQPLAGRGMGMGGGRGMGMGGGRGGGRGIGCGGRMAPSALVSGDRTLSKQKQLQLLKEQAAAQRREAEALEARIRELENSL